MIYRFIFSHSRTSAIFRSVGQLLAFAAILVVPAVACANQSGSATVIDGDTLIIGKKRVFLRGVDAPESDQICLVGQVRWECGKQAARELRNKIGGKPVVCKVREPGTADCWRGNVNLGSWMVSNGWAAAASKPNVFANQERQAKQAKRGIWRSEFVRPWAWRRGLRSTNAAENSQSRTCSVMGNITASGERRYFTPKARGYKRVQVDPANGERWFCSAAQAKRAGWKASR